MEYNKRIFSTNEFFVILKDAFGSMKYMRISRKKKLLDENFTHRIMLCVTEVNGCRACSYFHTELALKDGMSDEEITSILSGSLEEIPPGEGAGLFFVQHYADKQGQYDKEAWNRLVEEYGIEKARAILASARMIMMGNVYGIAYRCLANRLKGKAVEGSSPLSELGILLGSIVLIPAALINILLNKIYKKNPKGRE